MSRVHPNVQIVHDDMEQGEEDGALIDPAERVLVLPNAEMASAARVGDTLVMDGVEFVVTRHESVEQNSTTLYLMPKNGDNDVGSVRSVNLQFSLQMIEQVAASIDAPAAPPQQPQPRLRGRKMPMPTTISHPPSGSAAEKLLKYRNAKAVEEEEIDDDDGAAAGQQPTDDGATTTVVCSECGKQFASMALLTRHRKREHLLHEQRPSAGGGGAMSAQAANAQADESVIEEMPIVYDEDDRLRCALGCAGVFRTPVALRSHWTSMRCTQLKAELGTQARGWSEEQILHAVCQMVQQEAPQSDEQHEPMEEHGSCTNPITVAIMLQLNI